ncbi:MAG: branched-chain amino acid ABC transporter permease [Lentisphaeria bacterium]|nr:branched-chain amino acid ABC transporter permease [Lentisphaeria bacterium]
MSQALQFAFSGITVGSIYAIVAIGFNIIYSTTGVINFAQGEFVMLGGMTAVSLMPVFPLPIAILAAVVIVMICGGLLEVVFFRRLRQPSVMQMIVITIGLSIVIQEAALHIWDEQVRSLPYFTGTAKTSIRVLGAGISPQVLWVLGTLSLAVLGLHLHFRYTMAGKAMRACASNREAALLVGIDTTTMRTMAFVLSAGLGALAGCVMSPITMTHYDMGTGLAIKGFAAAILGGLGNHSAALLAGLAVGLAESFSVSFLPAAYKDAVAFAILIAILFIRPHGLFGSADVGSSAREF